MSARIVFFIHMPRNPETSSPEFFERGICGASRGDRRKCSIITPNYENCHNCPFVGLNKDDINLGKEGLRGGIEDSRASKAWRKNKSKYGIPHGDD